MGHSIPLVDVTPGPMSIVPAVLATSLRRRKPFKSYDHPGSTMMGPPSAMVDVLDTAILTEGTSRRKPRESRECGNGPFLPSI